MKRYIYHRCSTEGQVYLQQQKVVTDYLARMNISEEGVEIFQEKISGSVEAKDRILQTLLDKCEKGDVIYISELSRLGRSMVDVFDTIALATKRGITIIQCKDGTTIESSSIGGKALVFALSLAAEIELANIRQRTQAGVDARKELIRTQGGFISNTGRWCTRLGQRKGCNNQAGPTASGEKAIREREDWMEKSPGYKWAIRQFKKGETRKAIVAEFNENKKIGIPGFETREGKELTEAILSKWLRYAGLVVPKKSKF